ncbi:MAG: hypothetical protein ACKOGC_03735 [Anaerolineae bacterium]
MSDFKDVFGLGVLEALEVVEGVVFFAVEGLDERCLFAAAGFSAAVLVLVAADFFATLLTVLEDASFFKEAEAGISSATGMDAACFAASRQFGKKSSIR